MRSSIAWLGLVCGLVWLAACGDTVSKNGRIPARSQTQATISAPQPISDTTLPPPEIKISDSEPIPTVKQPRVVTQPDDNQLLTTPTPLPLLGVTRLGATGIEAQWVGTGAFKIVLVTASHPAVMQLAARYMAQPTLVPANLTVWFVTVGEASDVLREADTGFDDCRNNDKLGRPFASAESRALRTFLTDATFAVFIENAPSNILHTDSCEQNIVAAQTGRALVAQLNARSDLAAFALSPLPRVAGHFVDYLAGEGIGALAIGLSDNVVDTLLGDTLLQAVADNLSNAAVWLMDSTADQWLLSADSLIHPIALAQVQGIIYVLDSSRILAIDPGVNDGTFIQILAADDMVDNVRVLELLDLTSDGINLLALDRAGDIYRYDGRVWTIDRYDRPIRDRSAHYYTALAIGFDSQAADRRHLLESSAPLMLRYTDIDEKRSTLPDAFYPIDISVWNENAYVLLHDKLSPQGEIRRFELGEDKQAVNLSHPLVQPRQLVATEESLFVLDRDALQVQQFARIGGQRVAVYRFADNRPITAIWSNDKTLILAGRDALYLLGEGADSRRLNSDHLRVANQPHNREQLTQINNFEIPIGGPPFTQRDYQMAGAPRHYRLGVHEGFDFYWQRGTQVRAAASGTIIKADWSYVDPTPAEFARWRTESAELGYTSPDAANFFSGRQIWIDHGAGLVSRYLHLSSLDPAVQVGATVERGQIIGRVGNSGSPGMLVSKDEDAHLHFELRIGNGYLGQYMRPIEAREWLRQILR